VSHTTRTARRPRLGRASIRIGVSGWRYAAWRGVFYPTGLPHRLELAHLASVFPTVELNGSFYSLQHPRSWRRWHAETPDDFVFSVKGPRFLTHMLKLRGPEQPLANFFASGVLALGEKLGPILWQLPPSWRFDPERIETFLSLLPRDTASALRLARRRHPRMHGRSVLAIDASRPLRHAMEIRDESFLDERFVAMLRAHGVALVVAETARRWPMPVDVTAEFVYLRLHGDRELYRSGYGSAALSRWASRIAAWHAGGEPDDTPHGAVRIGGPVPARPAGRDVYCYFDNTDVKLRAPADARRLMRLLALAPGARTTRRADRRRRPATPARAPLRRSSR
jgi:uncharacterized protein YecE (DUF72 family)